VTFISARVEPNRSGPSWSIQLRPCSGPLHGFPLHFVIYRRKGILHRKESKSTENTNSEP
jgi:hypothetical protein